MAQMQPMTVEFKGVSFLQLQKFNPRVQRGVGHGGVEEVGAWGPQYLDDAKEVPLVIMLPSEIILLFEDMLSEPSPNGIIANYCRITVGTGGQKLTQVDVVGTSRQVIENLIAQSQKRNEELGAQIQAMQRKAQLAGLR